jgi:hypothetical protein
LSKQPRPAERPRNRRPLLARRREVVRRLSCRTARSAICRVVCFALAGLPMSQIGVGALFGAVERSLAQKAKYYVRFVHGFTSRSSPIRTITGVPPGVAALESVALRNWWAKRRAAGVRQNQVHITKP